MQDTQVVKVKPSIPMGDGALIGLDNWFTENYHIVYEKIIKPKLEQEKRKGA
ncbi:hypothetical protein PNO24_00805 [Gemella haemolysans]|uniref:hypothetical protein n=1 Tax=Gemella haemolysans TaxID=1379 RepID=UPI00232B6DDD|nr:hypothetical protein [Gemella haemolysans]MDB6212467.1 hypothetical protein [Gemella haemolysans]